MAKTITITDELEERLHDTLFRYELDYWVYDCSEPWEYHEDIKAVTDLFGLLGYDTTKYIEDYEERLKDNAKEVEEYEKYLKVNVHLR